MSDEQRAQQLIERHLEELADEDELAELDRLLSESPAVAAALVEAARVDALLRVHFQVTDVAGVTDRRVLASTTRNDRFHKSRWALAGTAAAVLVALGLLAWWPPGSVASHRVVAGMVEVGGKPVTRLSDNTPLRVTEDGEAVIELTDGSRATLDPASEIVIRSSDPQAGRVVELLQGGGQFCVPRTARDFRVETCSGSVTALGTDFGVNLWPTQGKGDEEMTFRSSFVLAVAVLAGLVEVDAPGERCVLSAGSRRVFAGEAEPPKGKDLAAWSPPGNVLGFTVKGQRSALERNLPGIQGALELTADQKQRIANAMQETVMSEAVRAAMATAKFNPNATQAQKDEAKRLVAEAEAKLQKLVAEILTAEQKTLVEKINAAAKEVERQVLESMQSDFTAAKGNDEQTKRLQLQMRQKVQEKFRSRAAQLFSPGQQAAFEKAASAQTATEKAAGDKPKKGQ